MRRLLLPLVALIAGPAAARPDLGTLTLDRDTPEVQAVVAGRPAHLAVLPGAGVALAPGFAAALPLSWGKGPTLEVGRIALPVRQATADIAIGGVATAMRVTSSDGPCCRGADGTIGAADLPWSVVRIGAAGSLPEHRFGADYDPRGGLAVPWRVGAETLRIILAPDNPETVATASAAAILARNLGGRLGATVRMTRVFRDVERPVRDLALGRPVVLLGFTLDHVAVRTADFEGDARLLAAVADPDAGAVTVGGADEIVVRHAPLPPQPRWAAITIGRDLLDACPAIAIYRKGAVGLACRSDPPAG